jgi:hypothetical protein
MLRRRIYEFTEPLLRPGEQIALTMVGFRPISRSAALMAVFPAVLGGFAVSTAAGIPAWVGGGLGGGVGAGLMAWFDQRRSRAENDGRSLSIGLVVTDRRLLILDLATGVFGASVESLYLEQDLSDISEAETERMQGSGLKRIGAVIRFRDGSIERVIPAKSKPFFDALDRS